MDIIDLSSFEKIAQIQVGSRPAGIDTDTENQIVYVSNPESKNISRIDLREKTKTNFSAGNSPLAIALSRDRRFIYVSDWYENRINVIRLDSLTIVDKINVGKSPAGLVTHPNSPHLIVANKDSDSVSIVDLQTKEQIREIAVQKAPFGVSIDSRGEYVFVTNVQSHSVSVLDFKTLEVITNIKVGAWPYQVEIDEEKKLAYVTNQRGNSISIINLHDLVVVKSLEDICEYPEGINVSKKENVIIIACWFDNHVVVVDRNDHRIIKKIEVSGGPRAGFGRFLLAN